MKSSIRVLALYLPQFHPIKENDEWWGKGFTEWTNVGRARRMFPGHYQPRVPADLGYYDLRVPEVRTNQAEMAEASGIEGFLYWHYWFGNGKQLMEMPINEVLKSKQPNFPFALAWANATWKGFVYGAAGRNTLIEQKYLGEDDYRNHFFKVLPFFLDERYIRCEGKVFFLIFQPFEHPDIELFIRLWQDLAIENGLLGIHFVAQTDRPDKLEELKAKGFDAVNLVRMYHSFSKGQSIFTRAAKRSFGMLLNRSLNIISYKSAMKYWLGKEETRHDCYPSIYPGWDHTPRSGNRGVILHGGTPDLFRTHCEEVFYKIKNKPTTHNFVILKSWNEWAEGNYMEPDLRWGHGFLDALKKALICFKKY